MSLFTVRYRVHDDRVEENAALVRAVYAELAAVRPDGLRYATFQLDDPARFMHLAAIDGDGPGPLPELPAFRAFAGDVRARCVEPPATTPLSLVGSYRLL